MTNTVNQPVKYLGISTAVLLVAAFVLLQPMNAYSQVGAEGILLNNCVLADDQPEDPIDMNTVLGTKLTKTAGEYNLAKTVHREKQIFTCEDANDPTILYTVEMAIFLEIIENLDTKAIERKQSDVVTCIKDIADGSVEECQRRAPSSTQNIAVSDCTQVEVQHPLAMNTVVNPERTNIVKTIDAEKEVYTCENGTGAPLKKVDQIIFTEIWEDLTKLPKNPVTKRTVESARCTIVIPLAVVESCIFDTVSLIVPP
jgi:hypothetical protein